jgi:hypothetical protein
MFSNNYGARVISEYRSPEDTYEVAVLVALKSHPKGRKDDVSITYETPITDDVLVHQTRDNVERVLDEIAALPQRSFDEPRDVAALVIAVPESSSPESPENRAMRISDRGE